MAEALMLFDQISNSRYFVNAVLILFLNKIDLFEAKLKADLSPISRYFSDYHGAKSDFKAGKKFFATKFKKLVRNPEKEIYIHYTNATDTNLLKITMDSVQDTIVKKNITKLIL